MGTEPMSGAGSGFPRNPMAMPATIDGRLRAHARETVSRWHVDHRPHGKGSFGQRAEAARQGFLRLNDSLEVMQDSSPLAELRGRTRLLRSAIWAEPEETIPHLPRVHFDHGEEPRILAASASYLEAVDSSFSWPSLRAYVDELQHKEALNVDEVWELPSALRFILLERVLEQSGELASANIGGMNLDLLNRRLDSLREIGELDWSPLLEPLISLETILRRDPAEAYARMDFDSRDSYRKRIAEVASHSECSEVEVARHALSLAETARLSPSLDPRLSQRRKHIGYYLVAEGFPQLAARCGYRPTLGVRVRAAMRKYADEFYIGGIILATFLILVAILLPLVPDYPVVGGLTFAALLLLLPAAQGAVDLLNSIVTAIFPAEGLPKLDFSEGIPAEAATLVAVPTLLLNEKQVRGLFEDTEVRFLANLDPNLHFVLLTDLPDSTTRPNENDSNPLVDLAVKLVDDLNKRYQSRGAGSFLLLHRHRIFNSRQGVWMGWERKRGKLLDLNKFLHSEYDSFPVKAGNLEVLSRVRYVITLDSDTQLPRGSAQMLAGAICHPLNRAVIDPQTRIVTSGYGILQPRIGVSIQSASSSRLASIYSGETGFDIYTRAVSDAYQDLYGEGIFTGKGIYEVATLHKVLDRRFPRNSLLSHDLIEGAYARAGLVSDIELIDDYPSHYSAYTRRKHRWVRGDWQISQWLFGLVPDEAGRYGRNPISTVSRWKILDNLRRSLVEPFTFFLIVAGWLGLPGGALYWTLATLFILFIPSLLNLVFGSIRAVVYSQKGVTLQLLGDLLQGVGFTFLNLVFLPHQMLLSIDAIVRSLVRRFVTGQRLLEWETAAEAESATRRTTPVDRYLKATAPLAIGLAILVGLFNLHALLIAAPILVLWLAESGITLWLNRPPREEDTRLNRQDERFLRQHALLIWRYFRQFGGRENNYLVPDNVREDGLVQAERISPTNLGLLLNARQVACELGYLTLPEFAHLTEESLSTVERMPKFRGHLFNWYETRTLEPIEPRVVSTVDSGNLAASLYTLHTGARSLLHEKLLSQKVFHGLRDIVQLQLLQNALPPPPAGEASIDDWLRWALHVDAAMESMQYDGLGETDMSWWLGETHARLRAIKGLLRDYMPWMLPEFSPLRSVADLGITSNPVPTILNIASYAQQLNAGLQRSWATLGDESPNLVLGETLRALLPDAIERVEKLADSLTKISEKACRMAEEMEFGFLLNRSRNLLSIGYDASVGTLLASCYDLLASEARMASFLAIANGDISQQSWFRLGRTHTMVYDRAVLLSWTGTMFEYMMPALWMRTYPDTLMSRTLKANAEIQIAYGRRHRIPWGISESGFATQDNDGNYQYYAFGVPDLSVKGDQETGPVVSPYSSFLSLSVAQSESIHNLRAMQEMGWSGAFGFYESADYSASLAKPELVREWMVHHQGMSLLSILNLLRDNMVQNWFHANPSIQATELLLQEKPVRTSVVKAEHRKTREHALADLPKAG